MAQLACDHGGSMPVNSPRKNALPRVAAPALGGSARRWHPSVLARSAGSAPPTSPNGVLARSRSARRGEVVAQPAVRSALCPPQARRAAPSERARMVRSVVADALGRRRLRRSASRSVTIKKSGQPGSTERVDARAARATTARARPRTPHRARLAHAEADWSAAHRFAADRSDREAPLCSEFLAKCLKI
jgi:hypothetical protein